MKFDFSRPITSPCENKVDEVELLNELEAIYKRYIVLPENSAPALALWTLATYLPYTHDGKFRYAPRLMILSPAKGCGKTTLLSLIGYLCERPLKSGNISPAGLYRIIEDEKPIIPLIDEGDGYIKGNKDMANILNNGFERGFPVIRCSDTGKAIKPKAFDCFTPVAVAAIKKSSFAPPTIDRSIIVTMRRKLPNETWERLPNEDIFSDIRQKCAKFAAQFLESNHKLSEIPKRLSNRRFDIWEQLLTIASFASDDWYKNALQSAIALSKENEDERDSEDQGIQLLDNIRDVFVENEFEKIPSQNLCNKLSDNEEWQWAEMGYKELPITPMKLSTLLRDFKIYPINIRNGDQILKGYKRSDFLTAWTAYLRPIPTNRYAATDEINCPE